MRTITIALIACLVVYVSSQGAATNSSTGCGTGCSACNTWSGLTNLNVCTSAAAGYYLASTQSGTCTACSAGAATCTSATAVTCNAGYILSGSVCTACYANCLTCSGATSASCIYCANGWLYATGSCQSTLKLISLTTATVTAAMAAGSCNMGDGNNNGICISATAPATGNGWLNTGLSGAVAAGAVVTNCLTYNVAGGTSYCVQCNYGYAPTNAATATSVGACASTNAITNCQVYNAATGAVPTCAACAAGWTPSAAAGGATCVGCPSLGVSCPQWPVSAGSFWTGTAWTTCGTNAATCTSGAATTTILTCASGYYLNAAGACVSGTAIANCWQQVSSTFCVSCAGGYYMSAPSTASACGTNCTACTGANTCITCSATSNLSSGVCVAKSSMKLVASALAFFSMVLYYFI